MTEIDLRPATSADEAFLAAAFAAGRPELALLPVGLHELQVRAQRSHFAREYPGYHEYVVRQHGRPVGRCLHWTGPAEHRLLDLSVVVERQGAGIGSAVLQQLLDRAEQAGLPFALHVWAANTGAQRLYHRLGLRPGPASGGYLSMCRRPEAS